MVVYLRRLCEFPVRWLDFGPYPSVCVCIVAAAAPLLSVPHRLLKSHGFPNQEVECTDQIQSCEVYSSYPHKVTRLIKMHLSG